MNHTSMLRNYTATLDNITMSKHLVFYGFLLLRGRSSVGGLIYLLRCFLFTAWHNNCNTKLLKSFLLVKMFLRGDYLKKTLFPVKIAFIRTIPTLSRFNQKCMCATFKFNVSSLCFIYSVGVCCTYTLFGS